MNRVLHTKLIVIAISMTFLGMAFSGLSGLAANSSPEVVVNGKSNDFLMESQNILDVSKLKERPGHSPISEDMIVLSGGSGEEVNSIPFDEGFETYAPQLPPDNPPWTSTIETGSVGDWEYIFETEVVGENPDPAVWNTIEGGSSTVYWSRVL